MAVFNGSGTGNLINGLAVADSISGKAGNDTLNAGAGDDTVYGGSNDDSISGSDGNDLLYGDFDPSEELVTNGSFTRSGGSTTITGWNSINPTTGQGPFYSGSYVALNAFAAPTYGEGVQQVLNTVQGRVYTGSFRAYEDNNGTANHTVQVEILDALGNVIFTQTDVILNQTSRVITFNFTAVSATSTIRITNPTSTNTTQTDLKLDNVSVTGAFDPTGDDTIDGGAGDDHIFGGAGIDTLLGGTGNDTLYGGAGNDSVNGDANNDTLHGDDGDDTLSGGDNDDLIFAGSGNDTLNGNAGNDTVYAGDGDDSWQASDTGDDLQYGGLGNDLISGDLGNDTVYGDDGNDALEGHQGADRLFGGAGNDYIVGADINGISIASNRTLTPPIGVDDASDDYLDGGAGNDTLFGNAGRDTLIGGTGDDVMIGGTGADVFAAQGADTITDFDAVTGVAANGNLDNDFVDLSAFYNANTLAAWNAANPGNQFDNALKWLRADQADGILQSAAGLRIQNGGAAVSAALLNSENTAVCFAAGTRLATAKGHRAIEDLRVGDLVRTADHGMQAIRWIGQMRVNAMGDLAPILFPAGALGNRRDLLVSPLHRMVLSGWKVELMFGEDEVIAAAKMLVDGAYIRAVPMQAVTYFHVMFDAHEIVFAEGAGAESFHPGAEGFAALGQKARAEILALLPQADGDTFAAYGPSARRSLRAHEARLLQIGAALTQTTQLQTAPRKYAVAAQ